MDELLTDDDGPVRELVLNRPSVRNALRQDLLRQLRHAILKAPEDGVRVLVIHGGESKSFCAGADLTEIVGVDVPAAWQLSQLGHSTFDALEKSPIPVIAAVHGHALGGGLELALASTFILAADDALFGLPETTLGLIPGYGGTQRLTAAIGRGPALRHMLAGTYFDAAEAARLGLLAEAPLPRSELLPHAREIARRIANAGELSVRLVGTATRTSAPQPAQLELEAALAALAMTSAEARTRVTAFLAARGGEGQR